MCALLLVMVAETVGTTCSTGCVSRGALPQPSKCYLFLTHYVAEDGFEFHTLSARMTGAHLHAWFYGLRIEAKQAVYQWIYDPSLSDIKPFLLTYPLCV